MRKLLFAGAGMAVLVSAGCATTAQPAQESRNMASAPSTPAAAPAAAPATDNPLLAKWAGSYGGVPPFAQVKVEHFKPALEAAMEENRREIAAIVAETAAPTFENTIVALEAAGKTFSDVETLYGIWSGSMSTPLKVATSKSVESKVGFTATTRLEEIDGGTLFTYRVDSESGLGGIFGKLADPIVAKAYSRTVQASLDNLADLLTIDS